jgi:flagellar biosynthetic protein flhB
MASEDQEKTEEPTSKKIEDARKDGNVPKSQDLSGFLTLGVAVFTVVGMLGYLGDHIFNFYKYIHEFIGQELDRKLLFKISIQMLFQFILMVLPIAATVAIAGIIANIMQIGLIFTTKPLEPNLNKINPLKGIKNLFSIKKFIESIKMTTKVSVVFVVGFVMFLGFIKELPHTLLLSMIDHLIWLKNKAILLVAIMLIVMFIIGLIDVLIVRFQYFKDLRMSKQEIKDEYKQMEGDPQVKARIRQTQMKAARQRMMQNIPQADVIITNPTHYAVALKYDRSKDKAPKVIAKGIDFLALRIKKIGIENGVQVIENPPLARALYAGCEVEQMIPQELFQAVAEVLVFVYNSNKSKFGSNLK